MGDRPAAATYTDFVRQVEPRLRHALIPTLGVDAATDAAAEALAYGWEHWDRIAGMQNPAGYLYRVARSRGRRLFRRNPQLPPVAADDLPHVEPRLPEALRSLSDKQRVAVWLVHGLGWRQVEVADLLGVSPDTVRTHLERGMKKLRRAIGGPI